MCDLPKDFTSNFLIWETRSGKSHDHSGRDSFNQNFRKFLKLNGSARSKRKSFEKTGPPFEVDQFTQLDRSDRNWPFHLTFSVKFLITVPRCSLLSVGVMPSNNIYMAALRSVCFGFLKTVFRESFEYSFRNSKVVFEDLWTKPAHIWVY